MTYRKSWYRIALAAVLAAAGAVACQKMQAAGKQEPKPPVAVALPTAPPDGAVVLYGGKEGDLQQNWTKRYTENPADWAVDAEGTATPKKDDIVSKQEFGDCYLHVEFREPTAGGGNSGVGLQGRYEIQIDNSYGQTPEAHRCGSFYSQKAPIVIASRKAGEWQTYDIIFRAPRLDANGAVTEKARATVFQNGVLIQNNEEFTGPTGIQYGQFNGEVKAGPVVLQGDHDPVQFRNVWIVPMP